MKRTNKEIKRFFRTVINKKHEAWILHVKTIQKILNEVYHETTEFTPVELHKNIKPESDEK